MNCGNYIFFFFRKIVFEFMLEKKKKIYFLNVINLFFLKKKNVYTP